jgi:uncharacterized protein (DUF488 family)
MSTTFFTIGYEGSSLEDFISTLQKAGVQTLIDVRDVPISRKKGFSKSILRETLLANDIEYVHLKGLGDPKPGREAARNGDIPEFQRIFNAHLRTEIAQADLKEAIGIVCRTTACLLCFERDCRHCHRSIVADHIEAETGSTRRNIGVKQGLARIHDRPLRFPTLEASLPA